MSSTRAQSLDRRELLKLGSAAALATLSPVSAISSTPSDAARGATTMLALADPRYSDSLIFARSLERQGARILPLNLDLARLWFDVIEPRLQRSLRGVAGLTLESDLFILERLAENSGALTRYVGRHDWRLRRGSTHQLWGSIELSRIAASLVGGEHRWAETLGEAIAAENGRGEGRKEASVRLNATAAADSPKFFVSWLMTWRT